MPSTVLIIDLKHADQRVDNFLIGHFKGVPRSRLYRALRDGEVRVNKGRVPANYRLKINDRIRLPPLRVPEVREPGKAPLWQQRLITQSILYEENGLLIINKPAGMAVHGGSGVNFGVIETVRQLRPKARFLELVHRLDRETSGCLMIATKRATLIQLHHLLQTHQIEKVYLALVQGRWRGGQREINAPLLKNQLRSGERVVHISREGKEAISLFEPIQQFPGATLMQITLKTGRMHQIRVHAAYTGHPIAGDEKYGDKAFNQNMRRLGLKRLFLHAAALQFCLSDQEEIGICACLDPDLQSFIKDLSSNLPVGNE